jgi:ligand-binding sensor domain-containing protein
MKWFKKFGYIGTFLIITMNGLSQYSIPDRSIHYRPGDWISYSVFRYVTSISVGREYTYFGTTHGILRYHYYRHEWGKPVTYSDGLENDNIRAVLYDMETSYLWCATDAGLSFRMPDNEEWRNIPFCATVDFGDCLDMRAVTSIGRGKEYLWFDGGGEIFRTKSIFLDFTESKEEEASLDEVKWSGARVKNFNLRSLPHFFMKDDGYIFSEEGYIEDPQFRQYDITQTIVDDFDILWIATNGLGPGKADIRTLQLELLPFGLYTSEINTMAWDHQGMWIGGRYDSGGSSGITWWDMENDEWRYSEARYITQLRSDEVNSIAADTAFIWFGTEDGLAMYDKKKDRWNTFNIQDNLWDDVVTSVVLSDSILWIGTESGINWMQLSGNIIKRIWDERLIHRMIYRLEVDEENVWAGTDRGIYRYHRKENYWEYMRGYSNLHSYDITAVSVFSDEVWFGADDGIEVYNKMTNEWKGFPDSQHPTSGPFNAILADKDAVWAATENGVLKYIKEEDRWRWFTTEDGLLDNSVRWILLDGDYVWFATGKGLTRFYWNAPYRMD